MILFQQQYILVYMYQSINAESNFFARHNQQKTQRPDIFFVVYQYHQSGSITIMIGGLINSYILSY
jgi:hypothetical protein